MRKRLSLGAIEQSQKRRSPLMSFVTRLVDLGNYTEHTPAESRWVRSINVAGIASLAISFSYSLIYALFDLAALWPVVVTNQVWNIGYVAMLRINASGRHRTAARFAVFIGLANTLTPAYFLGVGSGVYLFIVLVPMVGVLLSGPRDTLMRVAVIVVGVIAFVAAPLVFVDAPDVLAGSAAERLLFVSSALGVSLFGAFFSVYYRWLVDQAEAALEDARSVSERLLLNILPGPIAERLKSDETAIADRIDQVTVLFADLVDSTMLAERLPADELVALLDEVFSEFDDLTESHGLEKVATIGDSYFAVAGLDDSTPHHASAAVELALAMRDAVARYEVPGYGNLSVRLGLASGPVVAGVIGKRKFRYDLWGDTVNTASRMQSLGEPGRIHVTAEVQRALNGDYESVARGGIWVKGKGTLETYFLERRTLRSSPDIHEPEPIAG